MITRAKKTAAVRYMILVAMRKRMLPFVFVFLGEEGNVFILCFIALYRSTYDPHQYKVI